MKHLAVMLAVFLMAGPALADGPWNPGDDLLIKVERMVKIPNDPPSKAFPTGRKNRLGNYSRYYYAVIDKGQSLIYATYVRTDLYKTPGTARRYVGRMGLTPLGGGCGVIRFTYDVKADSIGPLRCNVMR